MADQEKGIPVLEPLLQQLEGGSNWVQRRDAATTVTLMIRQGLNALRHMAEDADPDVAHECRKSVEAVQADLTADPKQVEGELAAALRAYHADAGSATPRRDDGALSRPAGISTGFRGPTQEELKRWLDEIAAQHQTVVRHSDKNWAIDLPVGDGRSQTVYIDPHDKDSKEARLVLLYTYCGPANSKVFASALKGNMQLSHAAFSLLKRGEEKLLALVNRRRAGAITREWLQEDLEYLAHKGDRAESQLTEGDSF